MITAESTLGAGTNDPAPTFATIATSAYVRIITPSAPYALVPGGATIRSAISFWIITTAQRTTARASITRNSSGAAMW